MPPKHATDNYMELLPVAYCVISSRVTTTGRSGCAGLLVFYSGHFGGMGPGRFYALLEIAAILKNA